MLDTLKTLCALDGVSGDEGKVREYIQGRIEKHVDEFSVDAMGNIIAFKKGSRKTDKTVVLCAHMDEIGIVVTSIADDGYLKFAISGGVDNRVILGKTVFIGEERVFGVIGCKAIHLVSERDREKATEVVDMYIDIGAKNKEEAEKLVSLGDTGAFSNDVVEFGDGFIKAKAIDDRFGCAVLIGLIESDIPIDCWFVFTVQEEVGVRGATTAAFRTQADIALIIESTTAADFPSVSQNKKVSIVGKGAVIPFMDGGTIYDKELYALLTGIAEEHEVPWQTKNVISGGTDAQAFQRSRAGVKTAGIAAPVRNLHSPSCVAKISDLEAVNDLVTKFLHSFE